MREAGAGAIVACLVAEPTWLLLLWSLIYPAAWFHALVGLGHGLLVPTLLGSLGGLGVVLAIACGLGRLRLRDLGVTRSAAIVAAAVTAGAWAMAQIVALVGALVAGDGIALDPGFGGEAGAQLVGQLFGNALQEEILFRGFLLVQLVLVARRWWRPGPAWVLAIVISQSYFALTHIPQRWIIQDIHGWVLLTNLGSVMWFGILSAGIFVRTGNLMLVVGYHALSNIPLTVFRSPVASSDVQLWLILALAVAWPYLGARGSSRRRLTNPSPRP